MKIYYAYILKCSDRSYYTSIISNLAKHITEHKLGTHIDSHTHKRRPINLEFYAEFTNVDLAIQTEKQIKKWSRIKKLPNLAKKTFNKI
ncbi:GIY-YIG nuclease family protein [Flavivirga algicola]|uniref:GIY-YIG nuclease family protein n=1 Tax=Flavivirga algicola TaxID=2729136 RepID=A0ABX1RVN3_9FLAO|nr:GIY-YIG nuclease family protein [Flavivirga algicola]NMH87614.1 GIY-YIG nuclease family protein [Flavivirga algicola]